MLLFIALSVIVLLMWQTWQQDYGPQPVPVQQAQPQGAPVSGTANTDVPQTASVPASSGPPVAGLPAPSSMLGTGGRVRVVTDVLDVQIDLKGGDLRQAELLGYPVSPDKRDTPFRLMSDEGEIFVAQSGLLATGNEAPDHHAMFTTTQAEYRLPAGQNELHVPLVWRGSSGVVVEKIYTFRRKQFVIGFQQRVRNGSDSDWVGSQYRQLQRSRASQGSYLTGYTYTGSVYYSPETKYEKVSFDEIAEKPLSASYAGGWVAMIQHYFLGAWIPESDKLNQFYTKALPGDRYLIGVVSPNISIPAGGEGSLSSQLYVGPKDQNVLPDVAPGLELSVDYGVLTVIAQPLFWLLNWIHKLVGNWGWSIILLTLLIKLAFYKLSETSYRSMANMRKMQPRIQALRDRYGDDKQRLNQAMMEIYKKEKINPLGGCLPILVQIPVFISLYWVLLESVELRQAPFMLWLNDLSAKDPYYVLPVLMGASMFIQQKLNPTPPDPIQAKIMMSLPLVFTVMFLWFPQGLVLYWLVNNILSISQQWYITRRIEKAAH